MNDRKNLSNIQIKHDLFKDVKYYVSGDIDKEIQDILEKGSATCSKILFPNITHLLCGTNFDENEVAQATDLYEVPCITEDWIIASARLGRLTCSTPYNPIPNGIFAKMVTSLTQLNTLDRKRLFALITYHGGKVERNLTTNTTHLVCGIANGNAYKKALEIGNDKITIITPDWITECIKNLDIIDPSPFHPRLLTASDSMQYRNTENENLSLAEILGINHTESDDVNKDNNITKQTHEINLNNVISTANTSMPSTSSILTTVTTPTTINSTIEMNRNSAQQEDLPMSQEQKNSLIDSFPEQNQHNRIPTPPSQLPAQIFSTDEKPMDNNQMTATNQSDLSDNDMIHSGGIQNQSQMSQQQQQSQEQITSQQYNSANNMNNSNFNSNPILERSASSDNNEQQIVPNQQTTPFFRQQSNQAHQILTNNQQQITSMQMQQQTQQQVLQNQLPQQMQPNMMDQTSNQILDQKQVINSNIIPQQQGPQQQQMVQNIPQQQMAPTQRVFLSQQQFNQLNQQQQQQLLNNSQNQNVVIINQQQRTIQQAVVAPNGQQNFNNMQQGNVINQDINQMNGQQTVMQKMNQTPINVQPNMSQMMQTQQQGHNVIIQGQQQLQQPLPGQGQAQQQTFIRATHPQWQQGNQQQQQQRQFIHLDAQTHAHLQTLDPVKRAEYLAKLHQKHILLRQQVAVQQGGNMPTGQRPTGTQHIILRGQVPNSGQMQWMQQQQQRPILVRNSAPGLTPIAQANVQPIPGVQTPTRFIADGNPGQFQRMQLQPGPNPQAIVQGNVMNNDGNANIVMQQPQTQQPQAQQQMQIPQPQQMNVGPQSTDGTQNNQMSKTKTALVNMLSDRLKNNCTGNVTATNEISVAPVTAVQEGSAAGTLRLMTAQHNAALNTPIAERPPQEIVAMQHQQTANVQRRSLGNITNSGLGGISPGPQINQNQIAQQMVTSPQTPLVQSPSGMKSPPFGPGRTPLNRPQFYGHNPNLKLPPKLFLLGCIFYIVEYDETYEKSLPKWKQLIQKHGGEIENVYCPRVTHVLCRTQRHGVVMQAMRDSKRCVTVFWLNDTMIRKQVQPPSQALHLPMPSTFGTQRPATKFIIAASGFEGDERIRIKQMIVESGATFTDYLSRHNSVLICKKPEGPKYQRAKEWNIPVVNTFWLSDILQGNLSQMSQYDLQKYQQYNLNGPFRIDYSLVGHLMTAWKSPINLTQESHERVKRQLSEPSQEPKSKKPKIYPPLEEIPVEIMCNEKPDTDKAPKIIFSQVDNIDGLTRAVNSLGGEVVNDPTKATHIVLTRLTRTCKLLLALCVVDHVISSKWIIESAKNGQFLPTDDYEWNDEQFNETFHCNIQAAIKSSNRRTLFEGKTFYITPSVRPSVKMLTQLIEMCGGRVEKKRRTAAAITEANSQQSESYLILTCTKDMHLLIDLTKPGKPNRIICATELVMSAVMQQKIEVEPHIITYF